VLKILLIFVILASRTGIYPAFYSSSSKEPSRITCNLSFSSATVGMQALIYGFIAPPHSANVTIWISDDNGSTWIDLAVVLSNQNGNYSYFWTFTAERVWRIRASWPGDNAYLNATSPEQTMVVGKNLSKVTCEVSSNKVTLGENVTISGVILPIHPGHTVTIYISNDEVVWQVLANVETVSGGNYFYVWTPVSTGTHYLKASWAGDEAFMKAESPDRVLIVEEKSKDSSLGLMYIILGLVFVGVVGGFFLLRRNRKKPSERLSRA